MDVLGHRGDRIEGLAQSDNAFVGVDVHPQDIGEFLETDGLDSGYFHIAVLPP
jgi:hypothetical protein